MAPFYDKYVYTWFYLVLRTVTQFPHIFAYPSNLYPLWADFRPVFQLSVYSGVFVGTGAHEVARLIVDQRNIFPTVVVDRAYKTHRNGWIPRVTNDDSQPLAEIVTLPQ